MLLASTTDGFPSKRKSIDGYRKLVTKKRIVFSGESDHAESYGKRRLSGFQIHEREILLSERGN